MSRSALFTPFLQPPSWLQDDAGALQQPEQWKHLGRDTDSAKVSITQLLTGDFFVHANACAFPTGGGNIFRSKMLCKVALYPFGNQIPLQIPEQLLCKPAAKAEALNAWLFSDVS